MLSATGIVANNQEIREELKTDVDPPSHSKDSGRQPIPVESPDPATEAASDDGCVEDQDVEASSNTNEGVDDLAANTEEEALKHLDMPGKQTPSNQSSSQT